MVVYTGGFAAVGAEYVFRIDHDADPAKTAYSEEEALRLIDGVYAGIEMAGSPLPTINTLGPVVTASDFGNNFGLSLGARLAEFDSDTAPAELDAGHLKAFSARTEIDGHVFGEGGLFPMPGGPLKALAWLAGHHFATVAPPAEVPARWRPSRLFNPGTLIAFELAQFGVVGPVPLGVLIVGALLFARGREREPATGCCCA